MSNVLKSKILLGTMIVAAAYMHTVTLRQGSSGAQVMALQTTLGGLAVDGNFGPMTKAAVMAYQASRGLVADGVVGPMTGASLAGVMAGGSYPAGCSSASGFSVTTGLPCSGGGGSLPAGCMPGYLFSSTTGLSCSGGTTPPPSGLQGGAGSIDTYDLTSGLSNEEVGEDAEDVKVAGLNLENSDNSDLSLTAVRLVFNEGTAASDFDNYASEVSIWLGSKEVARVDADEFNDDNDWTKTVTLSGAILRSGDTEDLFVAVSGVSNLDTADATDTWTVDFTSLRYIDGTGASTSED